MFLYFSLLTACPHHHAACDSISTITSFKAIDFDQIDANTLVILNRKIKLPKSVISTLKAKKIVTYVFTSQKDLKEIFSEPGCHFNKIIFFGDKKKNVTCVASVAEELGVAYRGYILIS